MGVKLTEFTCVRAIKHDELLMPNGSSYSRIYLKIYYLMTKFKKVLITRKNGDR